MGSSYRTGYTLGLTKQQFRYLNYISSGWDQKRAIEACFDVTDGNGHLDEAKYRAAQAKVRKWMKDPKILEANKELLREIALPLIGKSLAKMGQLLDDDSHWLQYNSAMFLLNKYDKDEDDSKTIRVEVTGMPEIGTPDE